MATKAYTLPSGREVIIREMTALDAYKLQGSLPDIGDAATPEQVEQSMSTQQVLETGIRTICLLSVSPRFWADLRPELEQNKEPWECPQGFVEFDLDSVDFADLMTQMGKENKKEADEVRPLPQTERPS